MATIMRDGNWTKFGPGGRWHYTPPYQGPRNPLAPYRGKPIAQMPNQDLRNFGDKRIAPGGVLPGPGPSAGGRYKWYGPQKNLGQPSMWQTGGKLAKWGWKGARRLSPIGRALDLGFQLMDLWQVTQEEDPFYMPSGWSLRCQNGLGPFNKYRMAVGPNNQCVQVFTCTLNGQVYDGDWGPGSKIVLPDVPPHSKLLTVAALSFGPASLSGMRFNMRKTITACWPNQLGGQIGPKPDPLEWRPRITQPMPVTPPKPAPDPLGRPKSDPRTRPMPSLAGKPRTRTKPSPYYPNPPSTPVKTLPKPGEEKWVLRDPWIGDFYGKLTEVKDALKCIEKNTKGYRPKGGLFARMANLSAHIYRNPHSVDWRGVGDCLVANQIEDAVIGKVNQLANQITKSPYWVRPVGVGRGGFAVRMT